MESKVDYENASKKHPTPLSDETEELLAMFDAIEDNCNMHETEEFLEDLENNPNPNPHLEDEGEGDQQWYMDPSDLYEAEIDM